MSIINNSHAIGVDSRNLVLKTRGTLHVKVGDKYYEIDFRNLTKDDESKESEKEEFIISIDSSSEIDNLEYPGDNKLIIGSDGSWFITKNNTYVDISPKINYINNDVKNSTIKYEEEITSLNKVFIRDFLYGIGGLKIDFANDRIDVNTLNVTNTITFPNSIVKNQCCETQEGVYKYLDKDFIELNTELDRIVVKSGVMIKSNITSTLNVIIESFTSDLTFNENETYILYINNGEIKQSKIN